MSSPSNKSTPLVNDATAFLLNYNKNGKLDNKFISFIVDNIVVSEWERIHYMNGSDNPGDKLF